MAVVKVGSTRAPLRLQGANDKRAHQARDTSLAARYCRRARCTFANHGAAHSSGPVWDVYSMCE